MREGGAAGLSGMPQRPKQENDSIPKIAPKWLKHDRQVSDLPLPRVSARGVFARCPFARPFWAPGVDLIIISRAPVSV